MAPSEDLINFDVIEGQKENIQSLPGGRSAKKLAQLYSPTPLQQIPTPSDIKDANERTRAEYEAEVAAAADSDDPLDAFDRYVKWTFDAYPSAQATPQSQLLPLLERATKAFIGSAQYKNDPRYLKLWLHYIRFFSDAPRETFVFLSRHNIGEGLALYYEEYAAWLEGAGRWIQAEEVYKLGIEREARPTARLLRKFHEFEQRQAAQPDATDAPTSPAIPAVRKALGAKVDPFASARAVDPQAPATDAAAGVATSKPKKSKLAIFSDADAAPPALPSSSGGTKGWDDIGSLADRKKENTVAPKPWAGETLQAGGKKSTAPKMSIFRDPSLARIAESHIVIAPSKHQVIINPANGKRERVFVNLEAVYPTPEEPGTELSFEEIWAATRGWLDCSWEEYENEENDHDNTLQPIDENVQMDMLNQKLATKLVVHHDVVELDENGAVKQQHKPSKPKKKKLMEVNETQIIKAKLDSPAKPKMRKNKSSEPTMTLHTRAATDEIYDLFNAPLEAPEDQNESDEDEYMSDDDYTSGGESTCTTRQISMSEAGDDETSDVKSVSEWSDFTARKHIPDVNDEDVDMDDGEGDDTRGSNFINTNHDNISGHITGEYEHTEDHDLHTPIDEEDPQTMFVPIPPEDWVPNSRPYRDPAEVANNRLPFMTPITERTESSLGFVTGAKARAAMTPVSQGIPEDDEEDDEDFEPLSSPLREILGHDRSPVKIAQPVLQKSTKSTATTKTIPKGPLITDLQCNPVDEAVRGEILKMMHPPLSSYSGFFDHRDTRCNRGAEIRKFGKTSKAGKNGNSDRSSISNPITLEFPGVKSTYTLKRELGAGAFAPVYLVENSSPDQNADDEGSLVEMGKGAFATSRRSAQEALKMELPPTAWEFHMMRLAATRLGPQHRATASISAAHELHLYQDEGFLLLQYHPHGTLLDVVNFFREQPSGAMDEPLAMFFTIELLRTIETLHSKQILHGDLKADNCLLRLDAFSGEQSLSSQWQPDGSAGWSSRGIVLIDFGRGIDMRAFDPDVQFIADWKTTAADCAEMREGRPWTWQIDYHGLAGIVHCLLFGRYIETVRCDQGGLGTTAGRRYKIRESLKRYWQTDIWAACFDLLLNPGSFAKNEDAARMPVMKGMRDIRVQMETWLAANCEKGLGLKALMGRVEGFASARSRK
ncbi:Mad3/BUB1 homology region 1-domain-containing protein [Truncatella angustata]|uniref:Mad3/BUB1 homology region 1-domain-containing protein n=1 Tax=Truncatella angustata TaxID=152316 RepID=A0A9P8RLQ9_9PEZI|nr:Mad3/BUB1 homology region 1-domain-containing protein [Truncatella angustata]KAH6646381.1 Mad3/BUB1 homology region 1-domain-containing protein [Truncatella angustata]